MCAGVRPCVRARACVCVRVCVHVCVPLLVPVPEPEPLRVRVRLCMCVLTHRAAWLRLAVQGSAIDVAIHADVGPAPADVAATIDPAVHPNDSLRSIIRSNRLAPL